MLHTADCVSSVIAFDVDGTLVSHARGKVVWEVFNRHFIGNDEINAKRFDDFRSGKITYEQWVELDVREWQRAGVTRARMLDVIEQELFITEGARVTLRELDARGYRLAIVSGTLNIVIEALLADVPFEWVYTNEIGFHEDGTIESWRATRYDMAGKADALRRLAEESGVELDRFAFVGDNVNDCKALQLVSCSIAYNPKHDRVAKAAKVVIPEGEFSELLQLFPPLRT